jgi:hypothetical protein
MNFKHTPGPWFAKITTNDEKLIEIDNRSFEDDRMWMILYHAKDADALIANARLVTAAPTMIDELIRLSEKYGDLQTKEIITKALGGSEL